MKYHLCRTLGTQFASYDELFKLLVEIEDCLNSRILGASYGVPTHLSPGHFLIGELVNQLNAAVFIDVEYNRFGHQSTSRICNSFNAVRGQHLT